MQTMNRDGVLKLAKLARLHVADDRIEAMSLHLDKMLGHMEGLRGLDLSNIEPMTSLELGSTPLRADVPGANLSHEDAFRNAPAVEQDHFRIPKVMG